MIEPLEGQVWEEIKDRLKTDPGLSYVKEVFDDRQKVTTDSMPCIILGAERADEDWADFPKRRQNVLIIVIRGSLDIREQLDKQFVGDDQQVGIFRFEADIKNAIESTDLTFGNRVLNYDLMTEGYPLLENAVREVTMKLILYFKYFTAGGR